MRRTGDSDTQAMAHDAIGLIDVDYEHFPP